MSSILSTRRHRRPFSADQRANVASLLMIGVSAAIAAVVADLAFEGGAWVPFGALTFVGILTVAFIRLVIEVVGLPVNMYEYARGFVIITVTGLILTLLFFRHSAHNLGWISFAYALGTYLVTAIVQMVAYEL